MQSRHLTTALALLLVGCSEKPLPAQDTTVGPPDRPTAGPPDPLARPTVVFLGTSLTAGLGVDPEQAYPALIQQKADSAGIAVTIENRGNSGETSAGA
ncbi:MAG TPA: hypothetical protein VG712_03290, partial [Gemmatimonadales bacterium]|nr:hypothetical protein [Gemmatimonadales bacterium]